MRNGVKVIYLVLFFLSFYMHAVSQDTIDIKKYAPDAIAIDYNGGIYIQAPSTIIKLGPNDSSSIQYSNKLFGTLYSIDVINPLKILLFFKDQGIIVFLDSHLKELQTPVTLQNLGLTDVLLACNGTDNTFWVYDNMTKSLMKYDRNLHLVSQSIDISKIATLSGDPTTLFERDDRIYLIIPHFGVLIFGNSGEYIQTVNISDFSSFNAINESLFFYIEKGNIPTIYNYKSSQFIAFDALTLPAIESVNYLKQKLYVLSNGRIFVQKTKQ